MADSRPPLAITVSADNRASYDAIAQQWFDARSQMGEAERRVLEDALATLPPDAAVLDLGCGTGRPIAEWLAARGFRVTGVDQSPEMLAHAQRLLPQHDWQLARIEDFDTPRRFAAIIAWDSLFHIPRERIPAILAKVARWLEPGGRFVCTLGGSAHPAFEDEMLGQRFAYDSPPPDDVPRLLAEAGLEPQSQTVLNVADGGRDKGRIAFVAKTAALDMPAAHSVPAAQRNPAAQSVPAAQAVPTSRATGLLLALGVAALLYMMLWPVPIRPVAWEAPSNPGYSGVFAANTRLSAMQPVDVGGELGPESIASDAEGRMYFATASGWIMRSDASGANVERWANTGGRPLGMAFDGSGTLWVADALRGLLSVSPSGAVLVMATEADGTPIRYADDLDVAADGRVYLTDASTRFFPPRYDALQASILEVLEHRGSGRVIEYSPASGRTSVIAAGLVFPNGIAVTHDGSGLLVNEMGNYRVLRIERDGVARGAIDAVVTDLPGFPDNLTRGLDGRYWLALVSPRNALADWMSDKPMLRKMLLRLPKVLRPGPVHYGHVIAFDSTWRIVADLQDPGGTLGSLTHALETPGTLWLGSLDATRAARLPWAATTATAGHATAPDTTP